MNRAKFIAISAAACTWCGVAGLAQDKVAQDRAIMLQQFIVTATPIPKHPWRYASLAGVEILSRAADWKTEWWVDGLQRDFAVQKVLLPEGLLPHFSTPSTLIVDEVSHDHAAVSAVGVVPAAVSPTITHIELTPNFRAGEATAPVSSYDADTFAAQCNLFGIPRAESLVTNGWSLPYRLTVDAPAVPLWLQAGLCGKYGLMGSEVGGFMLLATGSGDFTLQGVRVRGIYAGKAQFWLTDDLTKRLQSAFKSSDPARSFINLIPIERLFSSAPPGPELANFWACESTLFVRWALFGNQRGTLILPQQIPARVALQDSTRAAAFWRFVAGAARESTTEKYFRQCFGFGYQELKKELTAYLPGATCEQPVFRALESPFEPSFRLATNDEQGRILGDWLRMKGESLQDADPALAEVYFRQAGKVLWRAYRGDLGMPVDPDLDSHPTAPVAAKAASSATPVVVMEPMVVSAKRIRDPAFLAVYGLYEHDIGDDSKARELLEAAFKARAPRPRADCELGLLRYAEAAAHPAGPEGKLSAAQTALALAPLTAARLMTPPSIELYGIMAEIWSHSAAQPAAADLQFLADASAFFPRNAKFACNAAALYAQFGFQTEAARTVDRALPFAADEETKVMLARLGKP